MTIIYHSPNYTEYTIIKHLAHVEIKLSIVMVGLTCLFPLLAGEQGSQTALVELQRNGLHQGRGGEGGRVWREADKVLEKEREEGVKSFNLVLYLSCID